MDFDCRILSSGGATNSLSILRKLHFAGVKEAKGRVL
jgi:hypothetical protein